MSGRADASSANSGSVRFFRAPHSPSHHRDRAPIVPRAAPVLGSRQARVPRLPGRFAHRRRSPTMTRTIAAIAAAAMLLAAPALARDDAALKAAAGAYVRHPGGSADDRRHVVERHDALGHGRADAGARQDSEGRPGRRPDPDRPRGAGAPAPAIRDADGERRLRDLRLEEIRALNRFIDTGLGARAMAKSGATMRTFNAAAAPMMRGLFKRMVARIAAEFRE